MTAHDKEHLKSQVLVTTSVLNDGVPTCIACDNTAVETISAKLESYFFSVQAYTALSTEELSDGGEYYPIFFIGNIYDYYELKPLIAATPNFEIVAPKEFRSLCSSLKPRNLFNLATFAQKKYTRPASAVIACISFDPGYEMAREFAASVNRPLVGLVSGSSTPFRRDSSSPLVAAEFMRNRLDECHLVLYNGPASLSEHTPKRFAVLGGDVPVDDPEQRHGIVVHLDFSEIDPSRRSTEHLEHWLAEVMRCLGNRQFRLIVPPHYTFPAETAGVEVTSLEPDAYLEALQSASLVITPASRAIGLALTANTPVIHFNPSMFSEPLLSLFEDQRFRTLTSRSELNRFLRQELPTTEAEPTPVEPGASVEIFGAPNPTRAADVASIVARLSAAFRPDTFGAPRHGSELAAMRRRFVFSKMPPKGYSGGRYHALTLCEAMAANGDEVVLVTNHVPIFWRDFFEYTSHRRVQIWLTRDFRSDLPDMHGDTVFIVPGMDRDDRMYRLALSFAATRDAHTVLVNFESPNWFNSLSPVNRDPELWRHWRSTAELCSLVLSTTQTGLHYARDWYPSHPEISHDYAWAAINSLALERVRHDLIKEKRILLLSARAKYGEHKSLDPVLKLITPALEGYTLAVLLGGDPLSDEMKAELEGKAAGVGANVEYLTTVSDREKFAQYCRAAALVFPSRFEGYGYPPIEAAACGTAVVAYDLAVLRETGDDWYKLVSPDGREPLGPALDMALAEQAIGAPADSLPEPAMRIADAASFTAYARRLAQILDRLHARPSRWAGFGDMAEVRRAIASAFDYELDHSQRTSLKADPNQHSTGVNLAGRALGSRILFLIGFDASRPTSICEIAIIAAIHHVCSLGIGVDIISTEAHVGNSRWMPTSVRLLTLTASEDQTIPSEPILNALRLYSYNHVFIDQTWNAESVREHLSEDSVDVFQFRAPSRGLTGAGIECEVISPTLATTIQVPPDYYRYGVMANVNAANRNWNRIGILAGSEVRHSSLYSYIWQYAEALRGVGDDLEFCLAGGLAEDPTIKIPYGLKVTMAKTEFEAWTRLSTCSVIVDFCSEDIDSIQLRDHFKALGLPLVAISAQASVEERARAVAQCLALRDRQYWLQTHDSALGDAVPLIASNCYKELDANLGLSKSANRTAFAPIDLLDIFDLQEREDRKVFEEGGFAGRQSLQSAMSAYWQALASDQLEVAFSYIVRVARIAPERGWPLFRTVELGIRLRRPSKVVARARQLAQLFPFEKTAYILQARVLAADGAFDKALKSLQRAPLSGDRADIAIESTLLKSTISSLNPTELNEFDPAALSLEFQTGEEWRPLASQLIVQRRSDHARTWRSSALDVSGDEHLDLVVFDSAFEGEGWYPPEQASEKEFAEFRWMGSDESASFEVICGDAASVHVQILIADVANPTVLPGLRVYFDGQARPYQFGIRVDAPHVLSFGAVLQPGPPQRTVKLVAPVRVPPKEEPEGPALSLACLAAIVKRNPSK